MKVDMYLTDAEIYAAEVCFALEPHCDKIAVAGSVRRRKQRVHDIEVVCIPKRNTDLFGQIVGVKEDFAQAVNQWEAVKGEPSGKYTRRRLPLLDGFNASPECDIFMADFDNFGWIYALRTGSSEFNQKFWLPKLRTAGIVSVGGYLRRASDSSLVKVPDEDALFKIVECGYIRPEERI